MWKWFKKKIKYINKMLRIIQKRNIRFSPSLLRNYISNNSFVNQFTIIKKENYLAELGIKFENKVNDYILNKFPNDSIIINRNTQDTINAIKNNVPIILQGQLEYNNIIGIPDIIIKSNFIPKLIKNYYDHIDEHYRIIDIKFMTLYLNKDKDLLLKNNKYDYYKSQVYIYNELLSLVQNFKPNKAYLLGRRWKNNNEFKNNCFDHLGAIQLNSDVKNQTSEAMCQWDNNFIDKFPNMKIMDCEEKKNIKNEITEVYYCSVKRRNLAVEAGVESWNHPDCNAELMGFNVNSSIGKSVDNILKVNQANEFGIIINSKLNFPKESSVEYFIDFEIANDIVLEDLSEFPDAITGSRIYLIGVLIKKNNFFKFEQFISDNLSLESEKIILDKLFNCFYINGKGNVYHWGHIEYTELKRAKQRHPKNRWSIPDTIDFCSVLKDSNVAVKGSMNYSLKSIGRALYNQGLIPEIWKTDNQSGKDTCLSIKKISSESEFIKNHNDFVDLAGYNKLDCTIMMNIIRYFKGRY